jgi:S-adenosylmethionine-diacylglycerol 3-amino-3-carboxypropyl transferase
MTPMTSLALRRAVHRSPVVSSSGLLERLFTFWFARLIYTQIWEDPRVDREALGLGPESRVAAIASAGCNALAYLADDPAAIELVDLNPAHVALTRLKIAAVQHLPDHEALLRFLGRADDAANPDLYRRHIAPNLDAETRAFWESPRLGLKPRLSLFARGLHRHGATNLSIGWLHALCRHIGFRPEAVLAATTLEEQRAIFACEMAPVFETRLARILCRLPVTFFSFGIPPSQYEALKRDADGNIVTVWRERLERLATGFPIAENPFAAIAFGRGYDLARPGALPDFLQPRHYEAVRERAHRIEVRNTSMSQFLTCEPSGSYDGYVLLDAQDWMTPAQLQILWRQICRTARPGARVVFRTAGSASPLEPALPPELLKPWRYDRDESERLHADDRSAIYGGFHLYRWNA